MADPAKLYTIPAGTPFVDALASGLLNRAGDDAMALADGIVLLPNRRACRALREAFLRLTDGAPLLLPRMIPIGDVDEDELLATGFDDAEIPPAISPLRRQLLLAELIGRLPDEAPDPAHAAVLAGELARLLDQVHTEGLSLDALETLAPAEYAQHWQTTLEFLKILRQHWPEILAAEGKLDPARRRDLLVRRQAAIWRDRPPAGPVIAAGSTASVPATAELLAGVADLPQGAVVLPGLDRDLDEDGWTAIDQTHPQFGMKNLLASLGIDRDRVADWPSPDITAGDSERRRLISQALRPATTIDAWAGAVTPPASALAGLGRVDAPGPQEEAGAIALLMRQALETPGRTAALVTPDRNLARRVTAELARWDIEVDDSGGTPLDRTPPGSFLRLTAAMIAEDLAPVTLLAALKHPLARGGETVAAFRARVRDLELAALRGPRPAPGFAGLTAAAGAEVAEWLGTLQAAAEPLTSAMSAPQVPLAALLGAHIRLAEWLAADDGPFGGRNLWRGEAGEAAALFTEDLLTAAEGLRPIAPAGYPALLGSLMAGIMVRPRYGTHPRLFIWGPLEARLQQADLVILGGLNEGSWPPEARIDPWMSRPMRARFGLPQPERRIGLAAHDFCQAVAAPRVVLTRAEKAEGAPTVPSRWLLRLEALLDGMGLGFERPVEDDLIGWYRHLDQADLVQATDPPAPTPPVAARPRRLSVTQIETWRRDPYAVYARHILGLKPLDPIDADPGAAERGTLIHAALDRFVQRYPDDLPRDIEAALIEIGREVFTDQLDRPGVWAFWWPRFVAAAGWFAGFERERRMTARVAASEVDGRLALPGPAGRFELTAKADRIDRLATGGLAILDYKTGQPPTNPEIAAGFAPQLPLEAAIAAAGGFDGVSRADVVELLYVRLGGGATPGSLHRLKGDPGDLAAEARAGLQRMITAFDDPDTPYRSRPRPARGLRFNDYDHLARIAEWSTGGGGED